MNNLRNEVWDMRYANVIVVSAAIIAVLILMCRPVGRQTVIAEAKSCIQGLGWLLVQCGHALIWLLYAPLRARAAANRELAQLRANWPATKQYLRREAVHWKASLRWWRRNGVRITKRRITVIIGWMRVLLKPFDFVFRVIRMPLQWLHRVFSRWSRHYRAWHEHPHHVAIHRRVRNVTALGAAATVAVKGVATLLVIAQLGLPILTHANTQTWTSQADFATFTHSNTQATADGKVTLATSGGGGGGWVTAIEAPSPGMTFTAMHGTTDNFWVAESKSDQANIKQWNGTSWVSHDNVAVTPIQAIFSFAANDTWAFGSYGQVLHWNGSSWSATYVQRSDSTWANFYSAWGASTTDIWAGADSAIFHLEGGTWVEKIGPGSDIGVFRAVSGTSATDVWAVDDSGSCNTWHSSNGTSMGVTCDPSLTLHDVYAAAANNVWALQDGNVTYYQYTGSAWEARLGSGTPRAVGGSSANNVWIVGDYVSTNNYGYWDGAMWHYGAVNTDNLKDVVPIGVTDVWTRSTTAVYHYTAATTYQTSGNATYTYTPNGSQKNDWTTASPITNAPTNTTVTVEYSADNSTWYTNLASVPSSVSLYIKLSLTTTDTSATPEVSALTVDFDPITVTAGSPSGGSVVLFNDTADTTSITWTAAGTAGVDHIHLQYSTNSGSSWTDISGATSLLANATSYTWNMPDISSSTVRIKYILENSSNAELASTTTASDFTLTYDPSAPVINVTTTSNNATNTVAKSGDVITVAITTDENLASTPTASIGGLATSCTGSGMSWSCTRTVTGSDTEGLLTVSVSGADAAGNTGSNTSTSITIDRTAPTITITGPTSAATYSTTDTSIAISGTGSDNLTLTSVTSSAAGSVTGTTSWSQTVSLSLGDTAITYTAHDTAGNTATDSITVTRNTAVVAPTITIGTPSTTGSYQTNLTTVTITGSAAATGATITSVTSSATGTVTGTTSWSQTVTLVEGAQTITYTVTDSNGQTATASLTVTRDSTAPAVAITSPTNTSSYQTNTANLTLSGFASDTSGIASLTSTNSATVSGTTNWSQSITLSEGAQTIIYTATDALGNTATARITVTYTPDAPLATVAVFSSSRVFTSSKTGSWTVSHGDVYSTLRTLLSTGSNFGTSGTIHRSIVFKDIDTITPASLAGVDALYISPLATAKPLTQREIAIIEQFVKQGGGLLEARNILSAGFRPPILNTLGDAFYGGTASISTATPEGQASPLFTGPFGVVTGTAGQVGFGANGTFSQLGGATTIMRNTAGPEVIALFGNRDYPNAANYSGDGNAVFIGDEEIFMNGANPGEYAGQLASTNNQKLALNTFAFLLQHAPLSPAPTLVDPRLPDQVGNLKVYTSATTVLLSYNPLPAGHSVQIWRSTVTGDRGTLLTTTSNTSYSDQTVTPGQTYTYTLVTVRASDQQYSEGLTATATISKSYALGVRISADAITIKPGATLQLRATVYGADGTVISVPVKWSVDPAAGSITSGGLYTASQQAGNYRQAITASAEQNGQRGSESVNVYVDAGEEQIASVHLWPTPTTLKPGQKFTIRLYSNNQNGTERSIDPQQVTWAAAGGTIDRTGTYTAGSATGVFEKGVTATFKDTQGRTWTVFSRITVTNETPVLTFVSVTGQSRVPVGETRRFYAYGYDQFNGYMNTKVRSVFASNQPDSGAMDTIGTFHADQKEGCYPWTIRNDLTINDHTSYAFSGVTTLKYTDAEKKALDDQIGVGFRQYQFVNKPGSTFTFIATVYNGWGQVRPHSITRFKLTNPKAGTITPEGSYTASTQEGMYTAALEMYTYDTDSKVEKLYGRYSLRISNDEPVLTTLTTGSAIGAPYSGATTSIGAYDQFGFTYTKGIIRRYSLAGSSASVLQNGQIETQGAEVVRNTIIGTANGTLTTKLQYQGHLSVIAGYAPACRAITPGGTGPGNTDDPGSGGPIVDGGGVAYFVPPTITAPEGSPLATAEQRAGLTTTKTAEGVALASALSTVPIIGSLAKAGEWIVQKVPWLQNIALPLSAVTLIATLPSLAVGSFQLLNDLIGRAAGGLANALQTAAVFRRRRSVGKVVKGKTKQPVVAATVQLLSPGTRRIVETQRTDALGQYVCLVDQHQAYILSVTAEGFQPHEQVVRGFAIHQIVRMGLTLENDPVGLVRRQRFSHLILALSKLRLIILLVGTVAWMSVFLNTGANWVNYALGAYYLFAWALEWYISILPRPFGVVTDARTQAPLHQVVVRIINNKGHIVGTEITNTTGQFRTLLPVGSYTFTYAKAGYQSHTHTGVIITRGMRSLHVDTTLEPQVPASNGVQQIATTPPTAQPA